MKTNRLNNREMENGLILHNMQHEEFALEYLYGKAKGNAARTYANIYTDGVITPSCYSASSKLLRRDDMKEYLSVKMDEAKELAQYRKIHNVEILSSIIDEMATTDGGVDINGNPNSTHLQRNIAISAIREQNKMLGLNEDKIDINVEGGANFIFNLIPPSADESSRIERELKEIRNELGDVEEDEVDAEDVDFIELADDEIEGEVVEKLSRRMRRNK
tara:strand:- start:16867 stop:17520 length:654 start_codon:yes stop_codon:yes gene_type:complete